MGFDEVTASSLVKIDHEGNVIHPGSIAGTVNLGTSPAKYLFVLSLVCPYLESRPLVSPGMLCVCVCVLETRPLVFTYLITPLL
jgi:hypothetical protein